MQFDDSGTGVEEHIKFSWPIQVADKVYTHGSAYLNVTGVVNEGQVNRRCDQENGTVMQATTSSYRTILATSLTMYIHS